MKFTRANIPDVVLIEPDVHGDSRGFFLETYHQKKYVEGGISPVFVQDNHSKSVKNILRGLHLQIHHAQGKLIRVLQGEIFDVGVDLRIGSPTFGQWVAETLSATNFKQLYFPPGFAHGFCVLSDIAEVEYKCTELYNPQHEVSLLWNDPQIGIKWPVQNPTLSEKDKNGVLLKDLQKLLS